VTKNMNRRLTLWNLISPTWNARRHNNRSANDRHRRAGFEALEQRYVLTTLAVQPGLDTLQEALHNAAPGDTLLLKSGVYLISDTVTIDKSLTIKGSSASSDKVVVAPVTSDFLGNHIFSVLSDAVKVTFADFTVQGAAESLTDDPRDGGDGIHVEGVDRVTITNVQAHLNGRSGIYIADALNASLSNVVTFSNGAFGIDLEGVQNAFIGGSEVTGNGVFGIVASGNDLSSATFMLEKTVAKANHEDGIAAANFKQVVLDSVASTENQYDGFHVEDVGKVSINQCSFINNLDDGLQLIGVVKDKISKSNIYGNRDHGIQRSADTAALTDLAEPQPFRRKGTTITVYPGLDALQEAVNAANPGDTLVLKPGLYLVSDTVEIDKDLTIKGSSSNADRVHIASVKDNFFGDDIFSVLHEVETISFANFTVQGGAEADPDLLDEGGDGINCEHVEFVSITNVHANLNGQDGIFVIGAVHVVLDKVVAVANGSSGFDTDSTLNLVVRNSVFDANGVSGFEAAGHDHALSDVAFTSVLSMLSTRARGNGENGIDPERFGTTTLVSVTSNNNVDDGFDVDRINAVTISKSTFFNNLGNGLKLYPVNVINYPLDFTTTIVENFKSLKIFGNRELTINHPEDPD
jgi:hypothetical protein